MTSYLYVSSIDKYLSSDGCFYTDEQLDYFDQLKREHQASLPNYTFTQLMEIFPEATGPARRGLKAELKKYKQITKEINQDQENYYDNFISKAHFTEQAGMKEDSDEKFDELRKQWTGKIKAVMFKLSYLDELEGISVAKTGNGITEADIARAKEVPIETFYTNHLHKHGKLAVGRCPFHNEKTGSFTIYLDQNSFWCYGCQTGGSVIDFIMQQNKCSFLDAVKTLLK